MNVYRTYISSSTIMITSTKRNKSKFRKVSAAAIAAAAEKYTQTIPSFFFYTKPPLKIKFATTMMSEKKFYIAQTCYRSGASSLF